MSMRLHNPLAARARPALDDSSGSGFLPSIDTGAASKPPFSSSFGNVISFLVVPCSHSKGIS
jgi:hypothetical protein